MGEKVFRRSRRGGVSAFAIACIVVSTVTAPPASGAAARAAVARSGGGPNRLRVGIPATQSTANSWDPPLALRRVKSVLQHLALQNQMLMGWGALNPEPAPGVFAFASLDARIKAIRSTGGTPVITLCGAPDWMKGGKAGVTDWSKLEVAPVPQYYAAYAQLAVAVAKRYPHVRTFQVWNEMKGFWNKAANRWNYEAYTAFYNTVYDALKAYDPTLRIGGPYVVVNSYARRQPRPARVHGA